MTQHKKDHRVEEKADINEYQEQDKIDCDSAPVRNIFLKWAQRQFMINHIPLLSRQWTMSLEDTASMSQIFKPQEQTSNIQERLMEDESKVALGSEMDMSIGYNCMRN